MIPDFESHTESEFDVKRNQRDEEFAYPRGSVQVGYKIG